LALSPDGRRLFTTHPEIGQISVINAATGRVERSLSYPGTPFGIAVDADGRHIFVDDWNRDVVSKINVASGAIITEGSVGRSRPALPPIL